MHLKVSYLLGGSFSSPGVSEVDNSYEIREHLAGKSGVSNSLNSTVNKIGSHSVAEAGLELMAIVLPQLSKYRADGMNEHAQASNIDFNKRTHPSGNWVTQIFSFKTGMQHSPVRKEN